MRREPSERDTATPMQRRTMIKALAVALEPRGRKTPGVFIGHGSPMNAVFDNAYFNDAATMGRISMRSLIIG